MGRANSLAEPSALGQSCPRRFRLQGAPGRARSAVVFAQTERAQEGLEAGIARRTVIHAEVVAHLLGEVVQQEVIEERYLAVRRLPGGEDVVDELRLHCFGAQVRSGRRVADLL